MKPARALWSFAATPCVLALAVSACPPAPPPSGPPTPGGPAGSAPPATSSVLEQPAATTTTDCRSDGTGMVCTQCSFPGLGTLLPHDTDPALGVSATGGNGTNPSVPHCFGSPATTVNDLLFLFLPGSGAVPSQYQMILYQARALGYYVLSLSWPNGASNGVSLTMRDLTAICDPLDNANPQYACWGEVRANRLDGGAEPEGKGLIWIDPYIVTPGSGNTIEHRLTAALAYLQAHKGWPTQLFLSNGSLSWPQIVVAGHSQGGGLAAFIGSQFPVKGVISFSSPDDAAPPNKSWTCAAQPGADAGAAPAAATWVKTAFASGTTPLTKYYGLADCTDPAFSQIAINWSQMVGPKLTPQPLPGYNPGAAVGSGVNVDSSKPPYALKSGAASHQLLTSAGPTYADGGTHQPVTQTAQHDAPVLDCGDPLDSATASCKVFATPICAAKPTTTVINSNPPITIPNPQLKPAWQQMLIAAGGLTTWFPATSCELEAKANTHP